jgi:hypothetical protein
MVLTGGITVQTRLVACLAGGFLGIAVTSPINSSLGLSPTIALLGCSSIGVALGYVASILFDIFAASPEDKNGQS